MTEDSPGSAVPDTLLAVRTLTRLARVLETSCDGLSLPQYRVLARIAAGQDRASRLSAHLGVAKPTITAAVDALVAAGHLTRTVDPEDRRVIGLALTPAGIAALARAEAAMAERLAPLVALTDDPAAFIAACGSIHDELERRAEERHLMRSQATAGGRP
jgi:DNA-binding MarR family transcriptional regulator